MGSTHSILSPHETQIARDAQSRLIPSMHPVVPGLDYYNDWRPAASTGGDYLDYFELDEGDFGLAIGNVAAHGVEAALLTTSLHGIVRALRFAQNRSVAETAANIDELFREIRPDNCYATLFLGRYDPLSGRLCYVNAGHEPPLVLRKAGGSYRTIRLEAGGPWLGMLRKPRYREGVVSLMPGDLLVAYTDGLLEAVNPDGEEWGWQRFLECLGTNSNTRPRDIAASVFAEVDEFVDGTPQPHDMTLWLGRVEDMHVLPIVRVAESCEEPVAA